MAEGQRFSERKSRLQDFKAGLQGDQGAGTQQTQQQDFGSNAQAGAGSALSFNNNTEKLSYIASNKLPGINTGVQDMQSTDSKIELPGITYKPASENDKEINAEYKKIRAENAQLKFIDAQERQKKYGDQIKNEYLVSWEEGARNYWRRLKGGFSQFQSNTLESIANQRIRNMERAGFDVSKDKEYVNALQQENLDYKKKINDEFKKWQKKNVNQELAEEYDGKTFTELVSSGDGAGFKYKFNKLFADNISLLPNIIITAINTPTGLTLMATDSYIQESEGAFEELRENGATYEEARNGAFWVGAINAGIELWLEKTIGLIGPASRGIRNLFTRKVTKEVIKNVTKKTLPEIIYGAMGAQLKSALGEGSEEFLQEIVKNLFVHAVNDETGILDNVWESFEAGGVMGLFVPGGALEYVSKTKKTNKAVDIKTDLEALQYVMEGEERKAQRMQQAKQRMKDRFLGKDTTEEFNQEDQEQFEREGVEEQQQSEELKIENNRETTIQNEMEREVLSEGDLNEDLGDPRFQKTEATDTNEINKDLKDIKDSLEKMDDNTFFNRIMASINKGGKRNFVVFNKNGQKSVLRVMETKSKGKGSGKTVTVQVMQPSKKSGNVIMSQFTYNPGNLSIEQKQGIITGFENWGKTGKFTDNTSNNEKYQLKYEEKDYNPGVANKNEKNISGKEGVKQRNKINDETIEQLAKKYGVKVEVIKGLVKVLKNGKWTGGYAYGKYLDQVLTLSEQIKESTAPHELLHAIFDMIDPETKAYLISQVMKSEGWSAKKAEEWLADSFSNFFRTGKIEGAPKSTWGKIKIFFKRVRSFINGLGRWRSELEEIFSDIITSEGIEELQGRIDQNQRLQEAKARMRERFMEYAKNAEKMQKKAEKNEGKYQEAEQDGINALQKIANGAEYVRDAMNREDLKQYGGETGISFYWGEPGDKSKKYKGGYGISHIAEKHGADTLLKMIEVLARGKITRYAKSIDRVSIGYDGYTAILSLSKDNGKETRLVTGRKDNEKKTDGSSEVSTQSTPTQTSPTFSRTDLGAVLSKDIIYKNDKNANKNEIKYQEADDIDPNVQSPNALTRNYGGLLVMDRFISKKQKKKALDVDKSLLVSEGRYEGLPYMWTHTNKYSGKIIPNFENVKDSRYKEFTEQGKEIAWFTNNEDMSKSYADQKSILANTRKFNSIKEFNDRFNNISQDGTEIDSEWKENGIDKWVRHEYYKKIEKDGDEYVLRERDLEGHKYKDLEKMSSEWSVEGEEKLRGEKAIIKDIKKKIHEEFIDNPDFKLYDDVKIGKKNGEYIITLTTNKELGRYSTKEEALAKGWADAYMKGTYHYKGIIQNMHNPLVVDMKNRIANWNDLGNAYDFLENEDKEQLNKLIDYIDYVQDLEKKRVKDRSKVNDEIEKHKKAVDKEVSDARMVLFEAKKEGDQEKIKDADQKELATWIKRDAFWDFVNMSEDMLYRDPTAEEKSKMDNILKKYPDFKTLENAFNKYGKKYYKLLHNELTRWDGFVKVATEQYGISEATISLLHGIGLYDLTGREVLKNKTLETNDYVFYALRKGGYDGVLFKKISDYGGKYIDAKRGGDVVAVFNSNQFKSWDNADPTDSKFISYQETEDNDGRALTVGQAEYFKDSKARVDESLDKPIVRVYHTTTDNIVPFSKFNPVGTPYYRFGENIVNYYTDDQEMSGSYSHGPYVEYTLKGEIKSMEDAEKYLDKLREEKAHEFRTGVEMNYSIVKDGNGYYIKNEWNQDTIDEINGIMEEANLTKEELDILKGVYDNRGIWDYGRKILGDRYYDGPEGEFYDLKQKWIDAENKINAVLEKRGTPMGTKYGWSDFFRTLYESKKNPDGYDTGMHFESKEDLIERLENEIIARRRAVNRWQYVGYLNITNPYIIDAEGRYWDEARKGTQTLVEQTLTMWKRLGKERQEQIKKTVIDARKEFYDRQEDEGWDWNGYAEYNQDYGMAIGDTLPDKIIQEISESIRGFDDGSIELINTAILGDMKEADVYAVMNSLNVTDADTTNDVVKSILKSNELGETNYDGVIIKNVIDYGGDVDKRSPHNVYVTFASNQFKSIYNENPTEDADIRYQTVYHGSQAEFDKFDSSHMGEGEGNQAHGRGHYVAVDPATARHYAEITGKGDYTWGYDGKTYNDLIREYISGGRERGEIALLTDLIQDMGNTFGQYTMQEIIDKRIERAEKALKNDEAILREEKNLGTPGYATVEDIQGWIAKDKKTLEALKSIDVNKFYEAEPSRKRNFYEVEIPDDNGRNYIEEGEKVGVRNQKRIADQLKKEGWEIHESYGHLYADSYPDGKLVEMILPDPDQTWENWIGYDAENPKEISQLLNRAGWVGIHYYGGRDGEAYVIFDDNDLDIRNHEKYQEIEYEYDENGNRKWLKFGDNSERDPSIFGEVSRKDQIEEDKENEKSNPFYNAWVRYNNQNYEDDQLTFDEFIQGISERADNAQREYDQKIRDLSESQNDPQLLDLQLRAVKLMEEEGKVGKKFGKNVSKEVRDRQQAEVEKKREQLIQDIVDYMYPGLKTEEITYDMQKEADQKEAEWEMLGKEGIEEKLKYFKKDKNGNWEAKTIKIENPQEKLDKLLSAGKFDEIFTPLDRVLEWKTPQGQKGILDNQKDPKKYKSVLEKINKGTTKTKVTLKDVTRDYRALEKYRAEQEAEKERRKKERQEEFAKKKQEEYKKLVRMSAFQRLIDMQRLEKYPFLSENEIKERYGFTDEEWKKITEQEEIKLPKKWGDKARSDFNKAVDSYVRDLIKGLDWQNNMKQREAEKNLGEIGEIDVDVLLGRDEEKGQKEVEEFEKISKNKQPEDKKKKAEELTKKRKVDVQEMFRKAEEKRNERYANKEEKIIDEVKTEEEAKNITNESRWKKAKNWVKETTIQDLIQPISSRIEQISPRIYLEMMRFEQNISVKTNIRMKQVEDFVNKMAEIRRKNKKDYINITLHLLNGNVGTANQMLEKYGASIPRQVLDEIWADAEDVGYTMNYEGFYYPRKVKDVKEFLERFAKVENKDIQGEIDKIVSMAEKKARDRGEEFTPQQKADLINQLLMDGEVEGISLGSGHMKKRKVESITKNMLEFYEDPVDALLQYISGMTEAIEKARLLGQSKKGEIRSLGQFIADEGIEGWNADELKKILMARFNYAPMSKGVAGLKNIANIIHLGSPSSALSQLADISFSLIENGLTNIVQGLAGKYNLDLDALGVTNRGEELKSQGKNETAMDKIQRFTFKMTGFNMMDQFGKKLLVVSTLNKLIKYAKNNDPQLRKDLSRRFDDPKMIDQIIEDLKNGVMSENVNLFLFTKLADVQPLTRTQMPKTYLTSGNGRIFYQFKTFAVKQLDYLIQKGKRDLKNKGTAKGLRSIVVMMGIIMLCGAGADELKDFTMGRKYSSWIWRMINDDDWSVAMLSDRFWDNLLKLTGLTKYSIYQARTQGIKSTVEDLFFSLSSLDVLTYPMQDIQDAFSEDGLDFSQASSWQLIPIVGKYGYRWLGAGQTKQQKKLDKEKKKGSSKNKSSKSTGSWKPLAR